MRPCLILALFAIVTAHAEPWSLTRTAWSFDRADLGDPAAEQYRKEKEAGTLRGISGWTEYDFAIPADGWYELLLDGGVPGWDRAVFVDGTMLLPMSTAGADDRISKTVYKETNLYLSAGNHRLRLRRLHFPGALPTAWTLRAADGPAGTVFASIPGQRVCRVGDTLSLVVRGSGPVTYEVICRNVMDATEKVVGAIDFAGNLEEKTLALPTATQGVFELRAAVAGELLRPNDFRGGTYVVIDTSTPPQPGADARTLVHDIDCVKQTDMGTAIAEGAGFWQAFEPTRVVTTAAGTYREGGNVMSPDIPLEPNRRHDTFLTGFSYAVDVPEKQVPYVLEVDYPDDDRRTTNVIILESPEDGGRRGRHYPVAHLGSGYETGDRFALTNTMLTHKVVFWPDSQTVRVALVTMNAGMRAAAAGIRVYRLDGGVPMGPKPAPDGRIFASWNEEPGRWIAYCRAFDPGIGEIGNDLVGMERYCRLARYTGMNAVNTTEAVYQGATFYSDELEGWFVRSYDAPRLMALLCEKYNMRYIPELHLSGQAWFHSRVVDKLADNPEELYVWSRLGTRGGANWFAPTWNALHPAIQQKYIDICGELADKLADSPAFGGISSRLMTWVWQSWNALPSLNWGYGDWTVAQYRADTGIQVPGAADDPERFAKRYDFLTSDAQRDQWVQWRCARMLDYYRRLRDRIRQHRPDAVLYLPYYGDAEQGMDLIFGSWYQTPAGALLEAGIDLEALAEEPGIAVFPGGGYGRRNSTPVADAIGHDSIFDPEHVALGHGRERGFAYGNAYFEVHTRVPIQELGLPDQEPSGYCGAGEAGGRNILAKFSLVLAEQDTNFMRSGGLGYTFGQPDAYREWLGAYTRLPREPFTAVPEARDPVAVWTLARDDGFWFYAVNREPVDIAVELATTGGDTAAELLTGDTVPVGKLTLQPYQLRAFRGAPGMRLTKVVTHVPQDRIDLVRRRLTACQELADLITTGPRRDDVTDAERDAFVRQLDTAWGAYQQGHYWRARTALSMSPMIVVFEKLATYPAGQLARRGGLGLLQPLTGSGTTPTPPPFLDAAALEPLVAGGTAEKVDSATYQPDWQYATVLRFADGQADLDLDVPIPGRYRLYLGHVSRAHGATAVSLGGNGLATLAVTETPGQPERTVFPVVSLPAGKIRLSLRRQGPLGIYGVILEPVYRPVNSPNWMTVGPFPTPWRDRHPEHVKEAMERIDPPMTELDFAATYDGADGRKVAWQYSDMVRGGVPHFNPAAGTSFLFRANVQERQVCYAVTFIDSPTERQAEILVGADWWANAYLNDALLTTDRNRKNVEEDGCEFNGWRPYRARLTLRKGINRLLVKAHGGTVANWFTCYVSDPGDLRIGPRPQALEE